MSAKGTSSSKMPSPNGIIKVPGGPNPSQSVGWGQKAQKQGYLNKYMWTTPTTAAFDRLGPRPAPQVVNGAVANQVDLDAWDAAFTASLNAGKHLTDFPAVPFAPNEYDTAIEIKSQVAAENNNWMVPLSDKDVQWLLQKRDQMEKAEFDTWIGQKFDMTDPAQVALFKNIAPEYFERRKEVIESQVELQKRVALLKLTGITSMDDLELAWAVETGRLNPVSVSVADPIAWRNSMQAGTGAARYQSGLFSPIKWLTSAHAGKERNTTNTFAAINTAGNAYQPQYYSADGRANYWGTPTPLPQVNREILPVTGAVGQPDRNLVAGGWEGN